MSTPGSNGPDQPGGSSAEPPAGGNPAGTPGQPGFSQPGGYPPPQGGGPYPPPQGGAPYPPGPGQPGQQRPSGRPKWLIPVIAGVVLIIAVIGLFAFLGNGDAEVGDCVGPDEDDASSVKVVDCDDDAALGKVIGVADDEVSFSDYQADPFSACNDEFPDNIGAFWQGNEGEDGEVVCVGNI